MYIVTSPTFGDFRSGEPLAFAVAKDWLNGKDRGYKVVFDKDSMVIIVFLYSPDGMFKFHVEEV